MFHPLNKTINPIVLRTAKTHRVLAVLSAIGLNLKSLLLKLWLLCIAEIDKAIQRLRHHMQKEYEVFFKERSAGWLFWT